MAGDKVARPRDVMVLKQAIIPEIPLVPPLIHEFLALRGMTEAEAASSAM